MKKLLSLVCVLALTVGMLAIGVVSASAEAPTTVVDVKSGDKVSYSLALSDVPEKIVGCDFSVYYDASAFDVESVADFNDSTNDADWSATINPDLEGEVRGNWSILRGVDFSSKRNIVTVNLVAKDDTNAHISYFVRYMYDDSVFDSELRPQIDQYIFTCDVTKNGETVVSNAQPELNVDEEQPNGLFDNSRTGKSEDADAALSGDSIKQNGGVVNENPGSAGSNSGSAGDNSGNAGSGSDSNSGSNAQKSNDKTTSNGSDNSADANMPSSGSAKDGSSDKDTTIQTDADGKVIEKTSETVATTAKNDGNNSSATMWIIIAAIVVIAGGSIAFVAFKGKKSPAKGAAGDDSDE